MTALDLNVRWYAGVRPGKRNEAPPIQVHHAATNTVLLRQNITDNFEAPFLYLLFGDERALLLDTGATGDPTRFPLRETVDMLMAGWLRGHPREGYGLVVAHSHAHGDHVAADGQFSDRPNTLVVGHSTEEVAAFFRLDWPQGTASFDLGGRVLEVIPTPGHHPSAVAFYDRDTGILLTGDTVYPGLAVCAGLSGVRTVAAGSQRLCCSPSGHGCSRRPHRNAVPAIPGLPARLNLSP
ncbi:MBL fold metallo-hydrolase [Pseudarthrobacter sp. So.54]